MNAPTARVAGSRAWVTEAIERIDADYERSAETHLVRLPILGERGIDIYLKDESTHPTRSLKHRLARSLFLYGLCNGWIREGTPIIEASSGSTAVSEAYFARLLDLPFVAVLPVDTSAEKIREIERYGGRCEFVAGASEICAESRRLARELGGHYMDQFTYAERATDWRGNNTIAAAIFQQLHHEPHPVPAWVVVGAGTGGTSATVGRYVRYRRLSTQVCVVDPEGSVYAEYHRTRQLPPRGRGSRIEGIGRPQVEPSFLPDVIDRMLPVADAGSIAAMRVLARLLPLPPGASTGTNFHGVLQIAAEMAEASEGGSIVSLVCDPGDRYVRTCYRDDWVSEQGLDLAPHLEQIERFLAGGEWARSGGHGRAGSASPRVRAARVSSGSVGAPAAPPARPSDSPAATQPTASRSAGARPPSSAQA